MHHPAGIPTASSVPAQPQGVTENLVKKKNKKTEFKKELETLNILYGLMYPT